MVRLYLMSEKGYRTLAHILEHGLQAGIADVVTGSDAGVERDYSHEIRSLAEKNGLAVYERKEAPAHGDWAIAISWRWLIAEPEKLIVLHDSLLPRYRGFAPLVTALKNGDELVGVTAIRASAGYDEGPIIAQRSMPIEYPIRIQQAIEGIAGLYEELVRWLVEALIAGDPLPSEEQDASEASYSLWLDEEDYFIDWTASARAIERHVHATGYPYRGAKTRMDGRVVTIKDGVAVPDQRIEIRQPGKVLRMDDGRPVVVCGEGLYKIEEMVDSDEETVLPLERFRTRFK